MTLLSGVNLGIPLEFAVICLHCEMISLPVGHSCGSCGDAAIVRMATALGLRSSSAVVNSVRKGGCGELPEQAGAAMPLS